MFDIDGTLIDSSTFEDECYLEAVQKVTQLTVKPDWLNYTHVTDSGILNEIIDTNNLENDRVFIQAEVKNIFLNLIKEHISKYPVEQISGAAQFIKNLKKREDVKLAIATGGWEETAKLKLKSGGIEFSEISFASSSEHFSRTEIMNIAESKCGYSEFATKTYFGDALWDQQASQDLGYDFILVGNGFYNRKSILNYSDFQAVLEIMNI